MSRHRCSRRLQVHEIACVQIRTSRQPFRRKCHKSAVQFASRENDDPERDLAAQLRLPVRSANVAVTLGQEIPDVRRERPANAHSQDLESNDGEISLY